MNKVMLKSPLLLCLGITLSLVSFIYVSSYLPSEFILFIEKAFINNIFIYIIVCLFMMNSGEVYKKFNCLNIRLRYKNTIHFFFSILKYEILRLLFLLGCLYLPILIYFRHNLLSVLSFFCLLACTMLVYLLIIAALVKLVSTFMGKYNLSFTLVYISIIGVNLVVNPHMSSKLSPLSIFIYPVYSNSQLNSILLIVILLFLLISLTYLLDYIYVQFDGLIKESTHESN